MNKYGKVKITSIPSLKKQTTDENEKSVSTKITSIKPPTESLKDILRRTKAFSTEEISQILQIKLANGEPLFVELDRNLLYNLICLYKKIGFEEIVSLAGNSQNREDVLYTSNIFKKEREKYELDKYIIRNKMFETEGLYQCKKCQSTNTITIEIQTRSADEPMTLQTTCMDCMAKWRA